MPERAELPESRIATSHARDRQKEDVMGHKNPFDEHTEMWADEIFGDVKWPWQACLGARLSDWLDAHGDHDRKADAPWWWRKLDDVAGWLYTCGQP